MTPRTFQESLDKGVKDREAAKAAGMVANTGATGTSWVQPKAAPAGGTSGSVSGKFSVTPTAEELNGGRPVKSGPSAADVAAAKEAAERNQLRMEMQQRVQELNAIYDAMFGDLDNLLRDRAKTIEGEYGDQLEKTASEYAKSLPLIESSYASVGADSSTDLRDANLTAKEGFEGANKTIAKNKDADLSKIGQYGTEQKSKWTADKQSANRLASRAGEVEDIGELRQGRNALEEKLGSTQADRGTLTTDSGARGQLASITNNAGRFEEVATALDKIVKGSMSGGVKAAAVQSVIESGGLNDEDKKKIAQQYGNTYVEQAAL